MLRLRLATLYVRKGTRLAPIVFGGHHERDRRPGTENVPCAVAFGAAAELAGARLEGGGDGPHLAALRDRARLSDPLGPNDEIYVFQALTGG